MGLQEHWDGRYRSIGPTGVSWYQAEPAMSLELLATLPGGPVPLIDIGGGSAGLVDALLARGWLDLTVLDISPVALDAARSRLGPSGVQWIAADLLQWWPARRYGVWHDRAVFHFLTEEADRQRYRERVAAAVAPGGYAVLATFAPDGPQTCSGLPVHRYDAPSLAASAAPDFALVHDRREVHHTPSGGEQPFTWVVVQAPPLSLDGYLGSARAQFERVEPGDLGAETAAGALLVDIRPVEQRQRDGTLPGAITVDRNVLEWRLVFSSPYRIPQVDSSDVRIVLVCNEGYASSLAAAALRRLGMPRATDLAGGFQAWREQVDR